MIRKGEVSVKILPPSSLLPYTRDKLSYLARGPGRFAWHHKALVILLIRREDTPRLPWRRRGWNLWERLYPGRCLPAISGTHHPDPLATPQFFNANPLSLKSFGGEVGRCGGVSIGGQRTDLFPLTLLSAKRGLRDSDKK